MARKTDKSRPPPPADGRPPRRRQVGWVLVAVLTFLTAALAAAYALEVTRPGRPDPARPAPTSVRVRLHPIPAWMSWSLAEELARSVLPADADFNDPGLARTAYQRLSACPWVRTVRKVQRHVTDDPLVGLLEVEADFRQPVAQVVLPGGAGLEYVDAEGVRLPQAPGCPGAPKWVLPIPAGPDSPARQVCYADRGEAPAGLQVFPVHYIRIEGVQAPPPPPGRQWEGRDLADALRMLELLLARRYANQILSVDVRNHGGRVCASSLEPHIRLFALGRDGGRVEVRFGRFPRPDGDYEISADRRLAKLDDYVVRSGGYFGRHVRVDLRYDQQVHVD